MWFSRWNSLLQESNVDECYAPDEQGITASLPQLAQLVMEHAAEEEEPHEEATMELTGTVSLSAAMADTEELHGGGITASLPAMADLLQELANDNGTDLDGVEDAASPPPSSSEQADEQADEQGAEMELTMNLGDALRSGVAAGMEQEQQEELTEGLGDVTAAVPNLADLLAGAAEAEAEADNTEGMDLTTGDRPTLQVSARSFPDAHTATLAVVGRPPKRVPPASPAPPIYARRVRLNLTQQYLGPTRLSISHKRGPSTSQRCRHTHAERTSFPH
jgi:hypothetical protein